MCAYVYKFNYNILSCNKDVLVSVTTEYEEKENIKNCVTFSGCLC